MKKILVLITLVATASAYSQGLVSFNNKVSTVGLDAPITYGAGPGLAAGTRINGTNSFVVGQFDWGGKYARAMLYGATNGTPEANLVPLVPASSFRTGSAAGYISGGNKTVDGVPAGGWATFQVRAWDAGVAGIDSYEAAIARGEYYAGKSAVFNIQGSGLGGGSITTPFLGADTGLATQSGLAPFSLTYVPEPSIIGLGILGAMAGLFVFRRRN